MQIEYLPLKFHLHPSMEFINEHHKKFKIDNPKTTQKERSRKLVDIFWQQPNINEIMRKYNYQMAQYFIGEILKQYVPRRNENNQSNFQFEELDEEELNLIAQENQNDQDYWALQPIQNNIQETKRIMNQDALERKREAFEQTKSYEFHREAQVIQHRKLIELVWGRIQTAVTQSDKSMKFLISYMKGNQILHEKIKLNCQQQYFGQLLIGTNQLKIDEKIIQCIEAVRNLDSLVERSDKIKFIGWMQNQTRERLEQERTNFYNQNKCNVLCKLEFDNQFQEFQKILIDLDQDVMKYFTKYEKMYQKMIVKGKKPQKDFLRAELKYKFAAQQLTLYQRKFGTWLLNSCNELKQLDQQRLEQVNNTLIIFQTHSMFKVNHFNQIKILRNLWLSKLKNRNHSTKQVNYKHYKINQQERVCHKWKIIVMNLKNPPWNQVINLSK